MFLPWRTASRARPAFSPGGSPSNDATKKQFETTTAAINVTPTPNGKYDIGTIKGDATWLSKAGNVNLIAALRIVVLEFQARPAAHLAGPLSTQDAVNLQEAAGVSNSQSSSLVPISGATMDADAIWAAFDKEEAKRLRIFQTYLSERRYLAMAADLTHGETLRHQPKAITGTEEASEATYPVLPAEDLTKLAENLISTNLKWIARTEYELAQEEENTNTFRLLADISLFNTSSSWSRRSREDDALIVPAGTYGRFITDTGQVHLAPETFNSELVLKAGLEILEETSKHLSGNKDIISIVCSLLDVYTQDDQATADGPGILVLTSCVQFLHATLPLCPTRVWSYMARCDLLNSDSRAGKLTRLVGQLDLSPDRFDFLLSRKSGNKIVGRQKVSNNVWLGVADKVLARVSLAIAQSAVDVFESSSTWRSPESLSICLQPASDYIIESFLSGSNGSLRFQALLGTWITALRIPDSTLYLSKLSAIRRQVRDSSYFESLRRFVRELQTSSTTARTDATKAAVEAKMAAYVAEIFAMQLYHQRQMGGAEELAKSLVADLDYFLRDGVEVASYNNSLHNNFTKNFASKYPGVSLDSLKRTALEPRELGKWYYYALDRANTMLDFDPGWYGRRDDGFRNEMGIANANLSLVDAQISLFHAWEFLLLELSSSLPENSNVQKQMLQVAQQCLNANQSTQGPENIFVRIVEDRANLALMLLRRLVGTSPTSQDIKQILGSLFSVINAVQDPFGPESIEYHRTILKTVYVTLRLYGSADKESLHASTSGPKGSSTTLTQTILNLLDTVVAKGFRSLISLVHDSNAAVAPEDFALLTAILQACLSMPAMDQCQTQILNIMADPIYGELSLLFLLELSTLPTLAEQMAADGLLSHLTSANITNYMRKGIISPFSDVVGAQRCYSIWAKGVLPLLLNLLTALGGTVAPEVAYVLNQFPHLLKSSVERFEAPGASRTASRDAPHYVTLLAVSEVHSLALLTKVIGALRVNNNRDIPEVDWDAASLLENVDFWLSTRKLLKERLLPLGQREVEWRGAAIDAAGDERKPDNVLEAKVVAQMEAVRDVLMEDLE
ncbi:Nucleoporin like protein [Verticillium longisporum]|nr:Nucleoporin like protein [Verticillium longisporum]